MRMNGITKYWVLILLISVIAVFKAAAQKVVFGTTTDVVGLSPILTNDSASSGVGNQIYETLFTRYADNFDTVVPLLAESYETPDNRTWIITLRKGIRFHDGTPFNAEAVKFTFERIVEPEVAAPRASILKPMESIEVIDEYTVKLTTTAPYGAMLSALCHANTAIVSPSAVKKYGSVMNNPVGTGPFKFSERVPGDRVTLVRNEDYWRGPAGIDTFVYKVIPEVSTITAMLETGDIDFMIDVPPEQTARLNFNPDVELVVQPGTRINYFGFNHKVTPLDNLLVRQAFAHAIDRDAYVGTLNGLGFRSNGIIGPKVFGYDPSIEDSGYAFNPGKAKELLRRAGYSRGLKLVLHTSNTPDYMSMAEIVQAQLKDVGVDIRLNVMEWGAFLAATRKHEHQLFLLAWGNLTADGSELVYPNLHPETAPRSNYSNADTDQLILASRATNDQGERLRILKEVNRILVEDVAMIPMAHAAVAYAYNKDVSGLEVRPNNSWFVYRVEKK